MINLDLREHLAIQTKTISGEHRLDIDEPIPTVSPRLFSAD